MEITSNYAYHNFYSLSISARNRRKNSGVKSVHDRMPDNNKKICSWSPITNNKQLADRVTKLGGIFAEIRGHMRNFAHVFRVVTFTFFHVCTSERSIRCALIKYYKALSQILLIKFRFYKELNINNIDILICTRDN